MEINSILSGVNLSKEEVISKGVAYFLSSQDPDEIEFVSAGNGWAIRVRTDEESTEKAKDFWERHISPKLDSEER